jgi:hypothetical protein
MADRVTEFPYWKVHMTCRYDYLSALPLDLFHMLNLPFSALLMLFHGLSVGSNGDYYFPIIRIIPHCRYPSFHPQLSPVL